MPRPQRPTRSYATDPLTRAVRVVALVGVASIAVWLLLLYPALPQRVPTHFDAGGTADAWGDKSNVLLLIAVFVVMSGAIAWLSTKPHWANYPAAVTPSNAQRLYREAERMLAWLLVPIAVLFAGIALSQLSVPAAPLLLLGTGGLLAVTAIGVARLLRAA
ncbi:DUF1648 domain-containing protein [Agrococcus sp. ProA11]|uniref:DUF1648 domain-containing protein n=1 Tax=Agrococcus chionoecetis TaxID=3153752 RepID=UPI003260A9ED